MERSSFYKFFPPPQFLQIPAVGLDISDASLRFVELIETHKGFIIGRFAERTFPHGIIESGEIKKPADLRAIFSDIKKQYGLERVSVSLPEEKAYLFELELPTMKYSEVRGAIELSLEEHVPMKAGEVLFDYEILNESDTALCVMVSAVPRTLVEGYIEAFSGSGIEPVAFEIETQSIARSVVPAGDKQSYMIVDFGSLRTGITIVSGGEAQFASTASVGGSSLTDVIAKTLNISIEEAEKVKREKGISDNGDREELSHALVSLVSILRDEIAKDIAYWETHYDDYGKKRPAIQKVYLCGGDSNLVGLVEYLATGISVPVEIANVFVNVNSLDAYVPAIDFDNSLSYAVALGLAIRPKE